MALSYQVFVRHEVYLALQGVRESYRDRILTFIESLAGNPFVEGDQVARDQTGRLHQIKIIGNCAVFYWPDHAEKEVRVIDLIDSGVD